MQTVFDIREGTTKPIVISLYDGDSPAVITGYSSVTLYLKAGDGTTVTKTPTVVTAATGSLTVSFAATDLLFSKVQYSGYIVVVDGAGKRTPFPSNGEFLFTMHPRYSNDT